MEKAENERLEGGRVRTGNLIKEMKDSLIGYENELTGTFSILFFSFLSVFFFPAGTTIVDERGRVLV